MSDSETNSNGSTTDPDPADAAGGASTNNGLTYTDLLRDPRATRENLAKWYYASGLTQQEIADRLDASDPRTISVMMTAYGIAPGRGNHAEDWVLARLPYVWAKALRSEKGVNAAPLTEQYNATVPTDEMPGRDDAHHRRAFASDVPDVYGIVVGPGGAAASRRGHDPEDLYRFADAYTTPDTVPADGLYVAADHHRVLADGSVSEHIAGFLLATAADPDEWWPSDAIREFAPDRAAGTVSSALSMLGKANIARVDRSGGGHYSYRLTDESVAVLRGEQDWSDADWNVDTAAAPRDDPERNDPGAVTRPSDLDAATLAEHYWADGLSYSQIADEYDFSKNQISSRMREEGLNPGNVYGATRRDAVVERVSTLETAPPITEEMVDARYTRLREQTDYAMEADDSVTAGGRATANETAAGDETETETETASDATTSANADEETTMSNSATDTTTGSTDTESTDHDRVSESGTEFSILPDSADYDDVEVGEKYWGQVNNTKPYGVFVTLNNANTAGRPQTTGLIHVSNLALYRPAEFVPNEDELIVKVEKKKGDGKIDLSLVERLSEGGHATDAARQARQAVNATDDAGGRTLGDAAGLDPDAVADVAAESETETDADAATAASDPEPTGEDPDGTVDVATGETETETAVEADADADDESVVVDGEPVPLANREVGDREPLAKLYYYYGLSQSDIHVLYDVAQASVSRAMRYHDISPANDDATRARVMGALRDEYAWAADLDGRGDGRPDGASAHPLDAALHAALDADPDVPAPANTPDLGETTADADADDADADDADADDADADDADADDAAADDALSLTPAEFEAMLAGDEPLPEGVEDTRPEPEPEVVTETEVVEKEVPVTREVIPDDAVVLDRTAFVREMQDVAEDLKLASVDSDMYWMARGKERMLHRLVADADGADIDLSELDDA